MDNIKKIIITGGAGFIGSHLIDHLLKEGIWHVLCVDNFDSFYDPVIKQKNIERHKANPNFELINEDIRNIENLKRALSGNCDIIVHLAGRGGVRPSILDPLMYQHINVLGTQNMLELASALNTKKFIFASSSSVYGINPNIPWGEDDYVLRPISPYAATKVECELLGHVYSHLYGFAFIALRFFTVYGPRQRPDLAIHKFARLMLDNMEIPVYGDGRMRRDYTYIDDIVKGISAAIDYSKTKYEIVNLGNNQPIELKELILSLENIMGIKAKVRSLPEQPGDVPVTFANIEKAKRLFGYKPSTSMEEGLQNFYQWLLSSQT